MNVSRVVVADPPKQNVSAASDFAHDSKLFLRRNHAAFPRVVEQAAGVHDRADVAERFEFEYLAGRLDGDRGRVEINGHDVAIFQRVAKAFGDFAGIKLPGGDAVAEENARETFGEDDFASGRAERDGRVLARAAAAEIFSGNDNRIFAVKLAAVDEPLWIERLGQAAKREAAELFVFVRHRRHERQILRGDDLVGVNVVAHHVNRAGKNGLHEGNVR